MNKLVSITLLSILSVTSITLTHAQEHKAFKVNLSLGYAQPTGPGLSAGLLIGLEPKYALSPRLDLGLRLESALLVRGVTWDNNSGNSNTATGTVSSIGSAVLTVTYLFNPLGESNTRPFLGIGAGLFAMSSAGLIVIDQNQTKAELPVTSYNTPGGMLRGGIKVGHFVASVEYNAIPTHVYSLTNTSLEFTSKSSYVGVRLGFDIGGGRK
ncbi:hypothetical protein CLV58_1312 [Spirosoma oryzae]|uniref:Outer membrane protein with beta-barrel domain n=1 Tax=Spirosoma oryzae TaxID=1469603 RepID=A0A2T0S2Y7_9BACT|nr:hypothetical protein [Spirosoma oryzae]PRY27784.1 hypothetical protein CLV58_1312 [Spirosoma oryzae]